MLNLISLILKEIIFRPIFNILLIFVVLTWGSLWWGIILLTIFIRLILLKPSLAWNEMQKHMADLQPKIKDIQERYKDDPQKMNEEMMKLFQQYSWSFKWMAKGCLMMLIQIPIFLGLLYVVKDIAAIVSNPQLISKYSQYIYSFLYPFGINAEIFRHINPNFFGINLLESHNLFLATLAGILMFIQFKFTSFFMPKQQTSNISPMPWMSQMPDKWKMMSFMNMFLVFMMVLFVYGVPAAIGLYIVVTTLFSILQMIWQYRLFIKAKLFK